MGLRRNSRACNKFRTKQAFHLRLRTHRKAKGNKRNLRPATGAEFNAQIRLDAINGRDMRCYAYKFRYVIIYYRSETTDGLDIDRYPMDNLNSA